MTDIVTVYTQIPREDFERLRTVSSWLTAFPSVVAEYEARIVEALNTDGPVDELTRDLGILLAGLHRDSGNAMAMLAELKPYLKSVQISDPATRKETLQ